MSSDPASAPRRLISLFDATMLVVGSMIGSGIFIVSAESARLVGTGGRLLLVWATAGLLTCLAALACAELAVMYPKAGGPYVFFGEAYGPAAGFLFSWTLIVVIQTGTIAAVCVAFARFLGVLVPSVQGDVAKAVAAFVILFLTFTNSLGLRTGTRTQNVLTVIKYAGLLSLTFGGLLFARSEGVARAGVPLTRPEGWPLALAFASALVGPAFAQSAWTNVTFAGAEVAKPERTFPRALFGGCLLVTALYVLANVSYLRVLGVDGIARAPLDRVGTASAEALLPGTGALAMAAFILVSTFGCANGLILSGSRVMYALAKDGLFFSSAASLNARAVPGIALWGQAVWATALALSGTYSELLQYVVSVELVVVILLVAAVVVLRRKKPEAPRPYRTWGYPFTPVVFFAVAVPLTTLLAVARPRATWPGYLIVAAGVPAYFLARRLRRSAA